MASYFEVLGLPRRFAIDPAELERSYLERSRAVHPDRSGAGSAAEAMQVNQAYRSLRRELPRAEHLLVLEGVIIGDNEAVSPVLLAEMLQLREELDAARSAGDPAQVAELERAATERERVAMTELARLFAAVEAMPADAPHRAERLDDIKQEVIRLRYLARLREAFDQDNADDEAAVDRGGAP